MEHAWTFLLLVAAILAGLLVNSYLGASRWFVAAPAAAAA